MTHLVHLHVASGTATITLDSTHNRNALSQQLRSELADHLDSALADPAVRIVVLTHTGPVFCAGADLNEATEADTGEHRSTDLAAILESIWTSPKPVIAKLAGGARAGGLGLVAACDLAVAADDTKFAFSEVRIGVVPALISVTVLPRLLPRAADELFLTGTTFDARRAAEIGLLTAAVPADQLDEVVGRYADQLALGAPVALAETKRLLRARTAATLTDELAAMTEVSTRHFTSAEAQEGIAAFAQKRSPTWAAPPDKCAE